MDEERVNAITCTTWVPRGAAKENPEKVEITKEDLAKIIQESSETLTELENVEDDDYTALEVEALEEDLKIVTLKSKTAAPKDVQMKDGDAEENDAEKENEDIEKLYDFDTYDNEKDGVDTLLKLGKLAVHADNDDDPNLLIKEDDDESETENKKVLPSDNLIAVGHVDGDAAILEVYVYNSEEGSLYVHHDILLSSIPLCMEWMNYDPEEKLKPGNMIAIGTMSPVIEIWDLDLVDSLEPSYVLGRIPKKKKKISRIGHSDAVLSLSWNKDLHHILASGSVDKSIILWDVEECKEAQRINKFSGKVQNLLWNPKETNCLLGGSCDKTVKLFDCVTENNCKSWTLDGEVEALAWDPSSQRQNYCYASTDSGSVYALDVRHSKPLKRLPAHEKTCTGISLNAEIPGCLVTVSEDETVKIWDLLHPDVKLVETRNLRIGVIHSVSCNPDSNFVLSFGGDNKVNNFKVWDVRHSKKVRSAFFDRLGLPTEGDDEEEEDDDDDDEVIDDETEEDYFADSKALCQSIEAKTSTNWKPKQRSKKKKGGHLDRKK